MRIVWSLLGLIAIIIIASFIYASTLIKTAVETVGTKTLGVPVTLGMAKLEPFSGELTLSDFALGNPEGYATEHALKVGKVHVKIDIPSLFSNVIVINNITVEGPEAIFEGLYAENNFKDLFNNLQNNTASEHTEKASAEETEMDHTGHDHAEHSQKAAPKVIIDKFEFLEGQVRAVIKTPVGQKDQTAKLPNLTLTNIGRDEGGLALKDVVLKVTAPIQKEIQKLAHAIMGDLKGELQNGVDTIKSRVKSLADDVKSLF